MPDGFIQRLDERTDRLLSDVSDVATRVGAMERECELFRKLTENDYTQLRILIRDETRRVSADQGWTLRDWINLIISAGALALGVFALIFAKAAV